MLQKKAEHRRTTVFIIGVSLKYAEKCTFFGVNQRLATVGILDRYCQDVLLMRLKVKTNVRSCPFIGQHIGMKDIRNSLPICFHLHQTEKRANIYGTSRVTIKVVACKFMTEGPNN